MLIEFRLHSCHKIRTKHIRVNYAIHDKNYSFDEKLQNFLQKHLEVAIILLIFAEINF